ncbi:hypothetical protein [Chitinophaga sp. Cy-1792]|uniref:hypothetical protein n=1 Tax=Chitinophaga sp. Cy-1792 TaxID=2608339 RepID=UPI00142111C0|nr:hypothetical protein [Chitinophaga sp. Cy-1792]NIG57140.1 hypothetical protein [Chitinophaga sp. Cy-1792]
MKKYLLLLGILCVTVIARAQESLSTTNLSVPQSAAFKLIDVSPTLTGSTVTPKAFALGVIQNFSDNSGWPQNYSAELTPYWWLNNDRKKMKNVNATNIRDLRTKNFASFIGLKGYEKDNPSMNPFAALKLASLSIAFANKNMSPDTTIGKQKIFSIGANATIVRFYRENYARNVNDSAQKWCLTVNDFVISLLRDTSDLGSQYRLAIGDSTKLVKLMPLIMEKYGQKMTGATKAVKKLLEEKPIFQWDASAAYAAYGVGDSTWNTGRSAIWSSAIYNVQLNGRKRDSVQTNYLSISLYSRYMYDIYSKNDKSIAPGNAIDVGGKIMLDFDPISFGTEYVHRSYYSSTSLKSQRFVGFINYRLSSNLYFSGTFGNDFGFNKSRLFSSLGINWGFGSEKISF